MVQPMLKSEIEALIGKEVTPETFNIYNEMYLALPLNFTKVDFVNILNIDKIPECPDAVERRAKRLEYLASIEQDIETQKATLKELKDRLALYKYYSQTLGADDFIKNEIAYCKRLITETKNEISSLKFLLSC